MYPFVLIPFLFYLFLLSPLAIIFLFFSAFFTPHFGKNLLRWLLVTEIHVGELRVPVNKVRHEIVNPGCAKNAFCATRIAQSYGTVRTIRVLRQREWKSCFYNMEGETCSFQEIVGGKCGFSSKDKEKSVKLIPLLNCTNNIDKHKSALAFTDVQNEVELILARARLFSPPQNIDKLKICPQHRETLGLGWKRSSTRCAVPALLSSHSAKTKDRPRAERGLTKVASQTVLNQTGLFIPVGSGEFS